MTDEDALLAGILQELSRDSPHDPDLANTVRRGARRRRLLTIGPIAAVIAVAVVLTAIWVSRPAATNTAAVATPPSACHPLETGPLPEFARAGFSSPEGNPFALSTDGTMVAVVFANPLVSPATPDRGNKILWVPLEIPAATDTLMITGHLEGTDLTTTVNIGTAPGPSYVDMPAPGCWRLDLKWGNHSDSMYLRWEAG